MYIEKASECVAGAADDDVVIVLSRRYYDILMFALGYASGAAMKDKDEKLANSFLKLADEINDGNPDYRRYTEKV